MSNVKNPSDIIDEILADPSRYSESLLDKLQADGTDTTDMEVIWSRTKPLGAERLADLSKLALTLDGPEHGPTTADLAAYRDLLKRGDRLSPLSRPTQWVITTVRGKSMVAWLLRHPPGEESSPDAPVFGTPSGWAVMKYLRIAWP